MASLSAVEANHAPQRVRANDEAPLNIPAMLVTLDTSHFERSALNGDADKNMPAMSVTLDTSHEPIGPRGPLEQSADCLRHSAIAARRSTLVFGAHTVSGPVVVVRGQRLG